ncbi:MAG: HAD family hydrolase [Alphaproteobacteria bacterium]|nr:HAD family hydrolase [Alphaproteobacteria bacterium]MBF0250191.1 HAD family hydrolase [Alphaproteobacteria bacterium]
MNGIDLVIFDCDGVLVDSEMIASRELAAYLTDLGRPTTGAECRAAFTGLSIQSVGEKVRGAWGVDLPADFAAALRERDRAAFERDLKAVPGVEAALDALSARGLPFCVASSGAPEKIRHSLALTGLLDRFDGHLFSAAQVARGKPAPDLFLHAATAMGAEPGRCLVLEDSPAGVQGAVAATMRAHGFTGASHCTDATAPALVAAGAVAIHPTMADFLSLLL